MADIPLRIICPIDTGQTAVRGRSNSEWRIGDVSARSCKRGKRATRVEKVQQTNRQPTVMSNTPPDQTSSSPSQRVPADCLSCRIIGTGALVATGLYALNQARAHQPGSPVGKRIMAGIGVFFLLGSVARWRT